MNMAYCKHCHTELEMGALFCPECGCREVEEPEGLAQALAGDQVEPKE